MPLRQILRWRMPAPRRQLPPCHAAAFAMLPPLLMMPLRFYATCQRHTMRFRYAIAAALLRFAMLIRR